MGKQTSIPASFEGRTSRVAADFGGHLLWIICLLWLISAGVAGAKPPQFVPGRILIKTRAGVSETNLVEKLRLRGASARPSQRAAQVRTVNLPEPDVEATLSALRNDPDVEFAERDYLAEAAYLPNDPYAAASECHLVQIGVDQAWNYTAGLTNVVVAVLDSGVNDAHPDLAPQLLPGYDFVNNDADPVDDFGHGTAVAGTAAAAGNNGVGVAGVAFGARVLPVKIMDSSGFATYSCMAQGIRYAVDQGARLINLSLAGSSASRTLQEAVDYAWSNNVIVVAAAGNNADATPQYPAACSHVVAVSATDANDTLALFSSYGSHIALAAPGDGIWTTQDDLKHPYGSWRGTSFACPIVAGVAALVASINPTLSGEQIVALLKQTADDLGPAGFDSAYGFGRINAFRAVSAASALPGALPPWTPPPLEADITAPTVALTIAPADQSRLTSAMVNLSGVAGDNRALDRVEVRVNDGPVQLATGTMSWAVQIQLVAGANRVRIRSVDAAGNISSEIVRSFTYVVLSPLSLQTNGVGRISPDLDGQELEIGAVYSIKAIPGKGQVFAGWNGVTSDSPQLSFVMSSNLVLVANFVPTPFPPARGNYAGLIANTNGVLPDNSGAFNLTVTSLGRFTGKVRLAGVNRGFHGAFDLNGKAVVMVNRKHLGSLTLQLHLDLAEGADQVSGRLTDGAWASDLSGDRRVFNSRINPAQQAGKHAFILQEEEDLSITAASGFSAISSGGSVRVKGRLQDGRAFSAASALAKDGDCPFYLSLNKGGEVVIGWLNFPIAPTPAASGTVLWVRTGTNAFAATLKASAAP